MVLLIMAGPMIGSLTVYDEYAAGHVAYYKVPVEVIPFLELLAIALSSVGIGVAQWLVLRRRVSRAWWWIIANTIGFTVAISAIFVFREILGIVVPGLVNGAITGWALVKLLKDSPKAWANTF